MGRSREFDALSVKMKKKFARLQMKLDEHSIKIDEIDEVIEEKTRTVMKKKLVDEVIDSLQTTLEEMQEKLLKEVANGYYDYIKDQAGTIIKSEFKKGIKFKHRVIDSDILHEYKPIEMMNNGWRIVYVGPLLFDKKEKNVFIFEKAVKNGQAAKVYIKSKKGKVKRNPK
jgi:hypothetical protein